MRRIVLAIVAFLAACVAAGIFADRWTRAHESAEVRAAELSRAGKIDGAERMYWALLEQGPVTVPLLVSFLDAHARAVESASFPGVAGTDDAEGEPEGRMRMAPKGAAIGEPAIDAFLARKDLPAGVALLGRYWRGVRGHDLDHDVELDVTRAADGEPAGPLGEPPPRAEEALHEARLDDAADRLLREGTFFHERSGDANLALEVWADQEMWERIDVALADPRVASGGPARVAPRPLGDSRAGLAHRAARLPPLLRSRP